jgi:hypothetical protein
MTRVCLSDGTTFWGAIEAGQVAGDARRKPECSFIDCRI